MPLADATDKELHVRLVAMNAYFFAANGVESELDNAKLIAGCICTDKTFKASATIGAKINFAINWIYQRSMDGTIEDTIGPCFPRPHIVDLPGTGDVAVSEFMSQVHMHTPAFILFSVMAMSGIRNSKVSLFTQTDCAILLAFITKIGESV